MAGRTAGCDAPGELLVVKLGGAAADHSGTLALFARELAALVSDGVRVVLVHGGGNEVSALTRRLGMEPRFSGGVRITSTEEMPYVDMVLCGAVNKRLVRVLSAAGVSAVGLSGSDGPTFTGTPLAGDRAPGAENHTASVAQVDTRLLTLLLQHGYVPVLAPTSVEPPARAVNINADSVALRLAPALAADRLLFLSDVPGIFGAGAPPAGGVGVDRAAGTVLSELTPAEAAVRIAAGTISGGMIPKVEAAVHALEEGVRRVVIGRFGAPGDLARLLTGAAGTTILPPPSQLEAIQEEQRCNEMAP